jgi:hypothetical protein
MTTIEVDALTMNDIVKMIDEKTMNPFCGRGGL